MRCPGKGTSVLPALCKTFGLTFTAGALLKLGRDILTFVSPQLLKSVRWRMISSSNHYTRIYKRDIAQSIILEVSKHTLFPYC